MTTRKTYPPWSEKELETLKELYPDNDNEYIGRLLNRTPGSVKIRAVWNGCRKSYEFIQRRRMTTDNKPRKMVGCIPNPLPVMQVYNFKVKSPKNLPYSAFTIKSTFYARLILHTFTHISVKICSFVCPLFVHCLSIVCPKFKVYAYIFYRDQREERAAGR